ncbi:predicted protein [Thalassiosira pseudonana CCMP1335]|uniref:BAR domain-containing protein n=1 Tax=Thalassiosira pseudonana TaxID=35128 RepID=B8C719_THAPS|nr:predicted protein [Thalassiosira pseudonana CCMP1335]EED90903.1 predicted protein [Thalassiosira pseudonana CCMP1335]|eukprot:scaffold934_cov191-Alexandrium_tamarense.AAC.18
MSTTTLDQEVDTAEGKYEIFRSRLHSLITTLKEHHGAMVKLNEAHLKTTKAVCDLLIDTKVSKVVIGAGDCPASSVIATKEISLKDQPHEKDEEENKENKPEVQENKPTDETKSSSSVSTPSKATEKQEEQSAHVSEAATTPVFHMPDEYTHSFHKVIDGKSLDCPDLSFMALFNASDDINQHYAEKFRTYIIGYLEQWERIVSTRIEGRMIEFRKMRQDYSHYVNKTQVLHEKADKQKARSKLIPAKASPRLASKLDRNILKLSGAEEAHDDYGRSLLLYIELVTSTYWKDLIPLLNMLCEFYLASSSDYADIMAKLQTTDANLRKLAMDHGVGMGGRLQALKAKRPESLVIYEEQEEHESTKLPAVDVAQKEKEEDNESTLSKGSEDLESV